MGIVRWDEPKLGEDVKKVEIHRSTTETGTYTKIVTIDAVDSDNNWVTSYDDTAGGATDWYKIRFLNTADTAGPFSTARKVTYRKFVTLEDFRALTNFRETEISDYDFFQVRDRACRAVLNRVTTRNILVQLSGTINGSNTDFTVPNTPIADKDLDRLYESGDVSVWPATTGRVIDSTEATVSSIDQRTGVITMTSAPTTGYVALYCTYDFYSRVYDEEILREAGVYYAAYLAARKAGMDADQWLELFEKTLSR